MISRVGDQREVLGLEFPRRQRGKGTLGKNLHCGFARRNRRGKVSRLNVGCFK